MYTREEEIRVIINLFMDYATCQKEAIDFLKSGNQRKFQDQSMILSCQEKLERCSQVLNNLKKIIMYFDQAYTPEQLQPGGIAEQRAQEGKRLFVELKKDPTYISVMKEIAHNSYFNNSDEELSNIQLPEEQVGSHLEQRFRCGAISKEQLILFDNYFIYLSQDSDYLDSVSQNLQSPSNYSR